MNKIFYILVPTILIIAVSCSAPKDYKYQDKPDVTNCTGIDHDLIKEALYSFEDDIEIFYDFGKYRKGTEISLQSAYSKFTYTGARGEADFNSMSSAHSLKIYDWLITETDLYIKKNDTLRLDYSHPFVTCIIESFENEEIKKTIQNLIAANSMSSQIIASPLRQNYIGVLDDKNFAIYMALDSYYKFVGLKSESYNAPPATTHEGHEH